MASDRNSEWLLSRSLSDSLIIQGYPRESTRKLNSANSEGQVFHPDNQISSLEPDHMRRITNFISLAVGKDESKLRDVARIMVYKGKLKEGCVKEKVDHLLEWTKEHHLTLSTLDRLFKHLHIKPGVYSILNFMKGQRRATMVSPRLSKKADKTANQRLDEAKKDHVATSETFRMCDLAEIFSGVDGVEVSCLREYLEGHGDHLKVFVKMDQDKSTLGEVQSLVQTEAQHMGYKRRVIVTTEPPPEIEWKLQSTLGSGTEIQTTDTHEVATVAGFLSDGGADYHAATVAHVFRNSEGDCLLRTREHSGSTICGDQAGVCVAKALNTQEDEVFQRGGDTKYYDFSWIQLIAPGEVSNAIRGRGTERLLHPRVYKDPLDTIADKQVFVCKTTEDGHPSEGEISFYEFTKKGELNFFGMRSVTGQTLTQEGDSGSLVISREPEQDNIVNAYGMIVAGSNDGESIALPFYPQLQNVVDDADNIELCPPVTTE